MKLSVCLAVYNEEKFIHYPLDSIYDLSDEIIIVDGGSSDNTIKIAKFYGNKIKIFHVILDKGRTDIEFDVTKLSSNEKHMIAISWSLKSKELKFYLDGVQKVVKTIVTN